MRVLLSLLIGCLCTNYSLALHAADSPPPLLPDGEQIENYQEFIARINNRSSVNAVVFSPDGQLLATADDDNNVRLWSVTERRELGLLEGHRNKVNAVAFSPDGGLLASASSDNSVRLWSVAERRELSRLEGHRGVVNAVVFSPDGQLLATADDDNNVRLWSVTERRELGLLEGHRNKVNAVAFSPDGGLLASASSDNSVRLWSVAERRELSRLEGHRGVVNAVVFSPDGQLLASAGGENLIRLGGVSDNSVRLWSVAERRELSRLEDLGGAVNAVAFSPDGQLLASAENDGMYLWSVAERRELSRLEDLGGAVNAVAFSPDGQLFASASSDNSVRLWSVAERRELSRLEGHGETVNAVAFSPDGQLFATASGDSSVRLWSIAEHRELSRLESHGKAVNAVAFSPDGQLLASASSDNSVRLWSVAERRELSRLEGHGGAVNAVVFSPDGQLLASASSDTSVRLWLIPESRELVRLEDHSERVTSVAFSPDGQLLVSTSFDNSVRLWSVTERRELTRLEAHGELVTSATFSPDGQLLALASSDTGVRLWSINERREVARLEGWSSRLWRAVAKRHEQTKLGIYNSLVTAVAFSPDGQLLASASFDNSVRLWSVIERRELARLEGHGGAVNAVAFSPDGQSLASASSDNSVRLWSIIERREMARLEDRSYRFWKAVAKRHKLTSTNGDKNIQLRKIKSGELAQTMMSGQFGTWISCKITGQCWRYDDSTFLVDDWKPVLPPNAGSNAALKIIESTERITVADGDSSTFNLVLKNTSSQPIYWIRLHQITIRSKHNTNPSVLYPPQTIGVLPAGKSIELNAHVTGYGGFDRPEGQSTILELKITSALGEPIALSIPVEFITPSLEVRGARITNNDNTNQLQITLKNTGQQNLQESSYLVSLSESSDPLALVTRERWRAQGESEVPYSLEGFSVFKDGVDLLQENTLQHLLRHISYWFKTPDDSQDTRFNLTVNALSYPPHRWTFTNQPISEAPLPWLLYSSVVLLILAALILWYILRLYRHPHVTRVSADANELLTLPLDQLPTTTQLLRRTRRLNSTLANLDISPKRLQQANEFAQHNDAAARAETLAARLQASCKPLAHDELQAFELRLPDDFILNLSNCILVFLQPEQSASETLSALKTLPSAGSIFVLISHDIDQRQALLRAPRDKVRLWVITHGRDLTQLLLSPEPLAVFASLLASQINVTRISPYQTRMGVEKEALFFGRAQLLADITGGDRSNHLIVGGRQLGKSSLLKAIQRQYRERDDVECHYLSVGTSSFEVALAPALKIKPDLESLLDTLRNPSAGGYRLLLIDEADIFLRQQAEQDYKLLNEFRNLSETGRCYFIFAGFWSLYYTISQDYQSPLKNFGATHIIGALEKEACYELATKPMAALNIRYESDASVEQITEQTGGRANLVAIACNALLGQLDAGARTINAGDVARALNPEAAYFREVLGGWREIDDDKDANELDEIVVYATVNLPDFSQQELMALLDEHGCRYTPKDLDMSLTRLELAFILGLANGRYRFQVPLFKTMIQSTAPEQKLEKLLADQIGQHL